RRLSPTRWQPDRCDQAHLASTHLEAARATGRAQRESARACRSTRRAYRRPRARGVGEAPHLRGAQARPRACALRAPRQEARTHRPGARGMDARPLRAVRSRRAGRAARPRPAELTATRRYAFGVQIRPLEIAGAYELTPRQWSDDRGTFLEWYRGDLLEQQFGVGIGLRQANTSISRRGVLRGVHYADIPPGQAKHVTAT